MYQEIQLHEAESFLRSIISSSWSRTSPSFDSKGSWLCSQEHWILSSARWMQFIFLYHIYLRLILLYHLYLSHPLVSSLWVFQIKFCMYFLLSLCMLNPHPSHPFWFNDPNNIQQRAQIMEVLIMQFCSSSC